MSSYIKDLMDKLRPKQKAVLIALYYCCTVERDGKRFLAIGKHIPPEAVQSKLKPQFRKKVKTALDFLCAKGLARRSPTRGGVTYYLTREGFQVAELLLLE